MNEIDKINGLITYIEKSHDETIERNKQIEALYKCINGIVKSAEESVNSLEDRARDIIFNRTNKKYEEASEKIKELSKKLEKTIDATKNVDTFLYTSISKGLLYFAVAGAVITLMIVFGFGWSLAQRENLRTELADLKQAIAQEQETLTALESKTWKLTLVKDNNGERVIIIPKGTKFIRSGEMQDGTKRTGIVLE